MSAEFPSNDFLEPFVDERTNSATHAPHLAQAIGQLQRLAREAGPEIREAWTVIESRLEAAQQAEHDRAERDTHHFERGLAAARAGTHELVASLDGLPFEGCPEEWTGRPLARMVFCVDEGDPSAGQPGRAGWQLAIDQGGTVLQELADAAHGLAPCGVHPLWTRSGGPLFPGGRTRLGQPFARITRFHAPLSADNQGWALATDQRGTMIEPLLAVPIVPPEPPPAAQQLLDAQGTPGWVVRALHSALDRPADQAAAEACVLARVLVARREAQQAPSETAP